MKHDGVKQDAASINVSNKVWLDRIGMRWFGVILAIIALVWIFAVLKWAHYNPWVSNLHDQQEKRILGPAYAAFSTGVCMIIFGQKVGDMVESWSWNPLKIKFLSWIIIIVMIAVLIGVSKATDYYLYSGGL
jgi:hypothetical protein